MTAIETEKKEVPHMDKNEVLIRISAIDERTKIILDQQKEMKKEISYLKANPSLCSSHSDMSERIQKLRISDAKFSGELNVINLKTKVMIGIGVVFLSSLVSVIVSQITIWTF